jgi:hypothetical protein
MARLRQRDIVIVKINVDDSVRQYVYTHKDSDETEHNSYSIQIENDARSNCIHIAFG